MKLKVISPEEIVFEGDVVMTTLPGTDGAFTVLKDHASLISTLTPGTISYRQSDAGDTMSITIRGGIADVDRNVISVCLY